MVIDTVTLPSEAELIADLRATFPGLHVRPAKEFGRMEYQHGVWTGGTGDCDGCMPDGLPIFDSLQHGCDDGYDGGVHNGFTAWLERRGWYLENYDGTTFFILPFRDAQWDMSQEKIDAVATRSAQAMRDRYHGKAAGLSGFAGDLGRLPPVLTPVPDSEVPF